MPSKNSGDPVSRIGGRDDRGGGRDDKAGSEMTMQPEKSLHVFCASLNMLGPKMKG